MGQLPLEGIWYERKRCYFVIGVVESAAIELGLFIGRMKSRLRVFLSEDGHYLTMKTCIGVGKTRCHGCHDPEACSHLICKQFHVAQALRQTHP